MTLLLSLIVIPIVVLLGGWPVMLFLGMAHAQTVAIPALGYMTVVALLFAATFAVSAVGLGKIEITD